MPNAWKDLVLKIPGIDFFFSGWGKSESRNFNELNWSVFKSRLLYCLHSCFLNVGVAEIIFVMCSLKSKSKRNRFILESWSYRCDSINWTQKNHCSKETIQQFLLNYTKWTRPVVSHFYSSLNLGQCLGWWHGHVSIRSRCSGQCGYCHWRGTCSRGPGWRYMGNF